MTSFTRGRLAMFAAAMTAVAPISSHLEASEKIGAPVHQALLSAEWVRVVVFLDAPPVTSRAQLNDVRVVIKEAQDRVLGQVPGDDIKVLRRMIAVPAFAASVSRAGIEKLDSAPDVVRVDLDDVGSAALAESVPLINADDVRALGFTGEGVTVAVLDSGIDSAHPDLANDLAAEACFCSLSSGCCPAGEATQFGPGAAADDYGHGSWVAGVITSEGLIAPRGTAPDASILAVKVLSASGAFASSDVIAGLDWILDTRPEVDVINMSLGTVTLYTGNCNSANATNMAYATAINALRTVGVLSVVASGNSGSKTQMAAPACIANAISVAAVYDENFGSITSPCTDASANVDKVTCFSNRNSVTDILAPGAFITSSAFGGAFTNYGTSAAAPFVTGCAANLLEATPGLAATAMESALESTGVSVTDTATSLVFPRVDCLAALRQVDPCVDFDADGYPVGPICPGGLPADCDDDDAAVHPGATETCNSIDDDCDLDVDEGGVCPVPCGFIALPSSSASSANLRAPSIRQRYGRSVYLITEAELSGFSSGELLHAIWWNYAAAPGLAGTGSLTIYLQNTTDTANTKSTTWATAIAPMTSVYSASTLLPSEAGWFEVDFPTPFPFAGDGLYVAFDWQYPTGTLSTTATVDCSTDLTNGLLGAQSATSLPTTLLASTFRPTTGLSISVPDSDISVDYVVTLGEMPDGLVGPEVVRAVVTNLGGLAVANVPVTLDISGAHSFSDVQIVPALGVCYDQTVVSFAPFAPSAVLGSSTVTVSVPPDDVPQNDNSSVAMDVTANRYSYKHPGSSPSSGLGFTGGTGELVARFTTTAPTQINAVAVEFDNSSATTYRVVLRADDGFGLPGAVLYQDAVDRTVATAGPLTIRLPAPVSVGAGSFFAGITQTSTTHASYSIDYESPIRSGTFFYSNTPSTGPWTDFSPGLDFKLNIGVSVGSCLVSLAVDVIQDGTTTACAGVELLFTANAAGGTGLYTYQWTENGMDIPGAVSPAYLVGQGTAGAFTYNCKVTDDAGCVAVQDAASSMGVWIAEAAPCDDGDSCTVDDACTVGSCSGTPIQLPDEVTGLQIEADHQTLTWTSVAYAGPGTVHDVSRGDVDQLPVGGGGSETCLGSPAVQTAVDTTAPLPRRAYWYLVRGRNSCGTGSYGTDSVGQLRITSVCP